MNTTRSETMSLIQALLPKTSEIQHTTIMIAPPFVNLQTAAQLLEGSNIKLGAQNLYWEEKGAFTGEISGLMLQDLKCEYVIIGHSERRQHFQETNQEVNKKVKAALKHGIAPIICVGETLDQREQGKALEVVESQVRESLAGFNPTEARQFTIAYEPVWAIGTGKAATPNDAVEVHSKIRNVLSDLFDKEAADMIRIQYGGSITAENIASFIQEPEVDGALVGGASLKADPFNAIIQAAEKTS